MKIYAFLLVGIFLSSFVSVLSKIAAGFPFMSYKFIIAYGGALLLLLGYSVIWQICLERISIIKAYAFRGLLFVLICIWSFVFFYERLSFLQIIGILFIICGVVVNESDKN